MKNDDTKNNFAHEMAMRSLVDLGFEKDIKEKQIQNCKEAVLAFKRATMRIAYHYTNNPTYTDVMLKEELKYALLLLDKAIPGLNIQIK